MLGPDTGDLRTTRTVRDQLHIWTGTRRRRELRPHRVFIALGKAQPAKHLMGKFRAGRKYRREDLGESIL